MMKNYRVVGKALCRLVSHEDFSLLPSQYTLFCLEDGKTIVAIFRLPDRWELDEVIRLDPAVLQRARVS